MNGCPRRNNFHGWHGVKSLTLTYVECCQNRKRGLCHGLNKQRKPSEMRSLSKWPGAGQERRVLPRGGLKEPHGFLWLMESSPGWSFCLNRKRVDQLSFCLACKSSPELARANKIGGSELSSMGCWWYRSSRLCFRFDNGCDICFSCLGTFHLPAGPTFAFPKAWWLDGCVCFAFGIPLTFSASSF